ncbi:shikimate kinase [Clostridium sp. HBUAS56017]|uniref:shikimate kinase n=1 Tax=Clostridium sp. HBUAS56017 TaxID=2571128 RepID=UPI00325A70A2
MMSIKDKVILIGMPGCGKSTLGKYLSEKLNYNFYDMDEHIQKISNKTIAQLFKEGEDVFRKWETESCLELAKTKKAVIASGGGVVKTGKNIDILKKDCIILFIDRPVEEIVQDVNVSTRPLLKDGTFKLYELYDERYKLYNGAADIIVKNVGSINDVVNRCKEELMDRLMI